MHWLWRAYQETRSIWVKRVKHGRKQLGMSQKTFFRQFHNGVVHISSDTRTMVSCTSLQTLAHWCRAHLFRHSHTGVVHISSDTRTLVSCTSLQALAHWCRAHLFRHSHTGVVHISSDTHTLVSCTSLQTLTHWYHAHLQCKCSYMYCNFCC